MVGKRSEAGRQGRIVLARLGTGPAARSVAHDRGLQIVAERGGKGALEAGRGFQMVDRAVAARILDGASEGLGLRFERGQDGPGRRTLAFGGIARGGGGFALAFSGDDRLRGLDGGGRRG